MSDPASKFAEILRCLEQAHWDQIQRADRAEEIRASARAQCEHFQNQRNEIVKAGEALHAAIRKHTETYLDGGEELSLAEAEWKRVINL